MSSIGLWDYQRKALQQMKNGCIVCSRVGSGKSRVALAYYYIQMGGDLDAKEKPLVSPKDLYIITTAKKRDDCEWEKEMVPFLLTRHEEDKIYDHKVVIDSWNNIKKYSEIENSFFIFDEDHVTGKGVWVIAFLKIAKKNRWIMLSATPGDKYEDYEAVFIANGFFKNKTEFERMHLIRQYNPHLKFAQTIGYRGSGRLDRLRRSILVDMDYKGVAKPHHETLECEFNKDKYKYVMKNRWNMDEDRPIENVSELCYQLRKIVNMDDSRQVKLLELFEKHPRMIIFYNMDCELEILRTVAEGVSCKYAEWNGHKHQPIPESESWMYFVHYNAGSDGWNCIKTDTIVFWSQTYSYRTVVQAAGRIDRSNTPFTDLYYYHLMSKAPIDLAIRKALKNKKKFNESAFIGGI